MKGPLYNNCISGIKPIKTKKGVVKIILAKIKQLAVFF